MNKYKNTKLKEKETIKEINNTAKNNSKINKYKITIISRLVNKLIVDMVPFTNKTQT